MKNLNFRITESSQNLLLDCNNFKYK